MNDQQGVPEDARRHDGGRPADAPDPERTPQRGVPRVPGPDGGIQGPGPAAGPWGGPSGPTYPEPFTAPEAAPTVGGRQATPGPGVGHPRPDFAAPRPAAPGAPDPGRPHGGPGDPFGAPGHGPADPFRAPAASGPAHPFDARSQGPANPFAAPGQHPSGSPATASGAAPGSRRGRKRVLAWTSAAVAAVLVVVAGGLTATRLLRDDAEVPADLGASEFAEVRLDVPTDFTFATRVSWNLDDIQVNGEPAQSGDVVEVYVDPELTIPATDGVARYNWGSLEVFPLKEHPLDSTTPDGRKVKLQEPGRWSLSDRYYIAERLDRKTGEWLATPRVTAFTVATEIPSTPVTFEVDGKGVGHFSWEEVPGAKEYYVVRLGDVAGARILGSTEDTTWNTVEQDDSVYETISGWGKVLRQNGDFSRSVYSDDDAQTDLNALKADDEDRPSAYGVLAVTDEGTGPLTLIDGAVVESQLPVTIARNAAEELGAGSSSDVRASGTLPPNSAVSMADGRTVVRPLDYAVDQVGESVWGIGFDIPYVISGTMFTDAFTVRAPDLATAQEWARTAAANAVTGRVRTGDSEAYTYRRPVPDDLDGADISRSAPKVPYRVNGSNPLTTYLAANLLDGQQFVSLADYLPKGSTVTPSGVELWDAFAEAVDQNPLVLGGWEIEVGYASEEQILVLRYVGWDDDLGARRQEQEQIAAEVTRVAGQIVTDGMSEEDKVRAINDYLVGTAEYDYVALDARDTTGDVSGHERAWAPSGVLLDKSGVCASYAQAFKVLADEVGLESVYVTGIANASGEGHAWNKIRIGDTWRIVDATWNDSDPANRYLLQTDADAAPERTQDNEWMVDSRVADYAAS